MSTAIEHPPPSDVVAGQGTWTWRGPSLRDPRLHVAAVLLSLQVLGQTVIDFDLSIAQILLAIGTCAVLEVTIGAVRHRTIAWPASAMLTGNGVALLLRVPGTEHGDWWSTRGGWIFVGTAAASLLSKHVIRWRGHHLFNPSNLGLAACFLVLGSSRVDPQDLWWGPLSPGIVAVLVLITVGGLTVPRRLGLLPLAMAFWVPFTVLVGVLAASGHAMTARWHYGPVTGWTYWSVLSFSPEILVFLFFMITDPKTVPASGRARLAFGAFVGVAAALIVAAQTTEYATKVAILVALVLACGVRAAVRVRPTVSLPLQTARPPAAVLASVGALLVAAVAVVVLSPGRTTAPTAAAGFEGDLPRIEIDAQVRREVSGLDGAAAEAMVGDLLAGLANEAEAVRTGKAALLERSTTGDRLDDLQRRAEATRAGDPVTVPVHDPDRATVVVVAPRTSPQSLPVLGVHLEGTVVGVTWIGDHETGRGEPSVLDATFVLQQVGGRYLIAGDRSQSEDPTEVPTVATAEVTEGVSFGTVIDEGSQPGQIDLFDDVTDEAGVRIDTTPLQVDRLAEPVPGFWDQVSVFDLINSTQRYYSAGQAWGDVDGDGVLDLYLTDQGGPNHLFLGRGDGTFQPAPGPLADPVTMAGSASGAATFVDYDNSGWPSLLVLTEHGPRLFRNEGGRSFADVTEAAGLVDDGKGETASWADFDGDGDLDLF
ncbi:MAG: VCBS repeat-containing protein, partial [Acidimicrobiales bacterium]|nr:VCBS repeat-containing protein [Acidimicrobiales bacterium]